MQSCRVVLRERCDPVTVFARRRRFQLGTTATGELGIPPLAGAARLAAVCGLFVILVGSRAFAQTTITVNTPADEFGGVGSGCSLREAIQAANTNAAFGGCPAGSGGDTIVVPAGTYTLSIAGAGENANASGDLDIVGFLADLTINGSGAATTIIDGADLDRVFHVVQGTTEISGLTIQNGSVADDSGGGILNWSALILNNSTVRDNTAISAVFGVKGTGGGIESGGVGAQLTLNSSTVSGNTATYSAGGVHNVGTVTLNSSTLSGNTAGSHGAGLTNCCGGTATLNSSTVSGNTAGDDGGGGGIFNSGQMIISNSTVSGNTATSHVGGGISNSGAAVLNNSTLSGNTATIGGGIFTWGGGSTTLKNTIVANSSPADCSADGGTITSAGHNLIENTSGCTIGGDTAGNITGVDPVLGPLADNGGPTKTHALLAGSPAIDAGSTDCPPPFTDQRGVARPQGAACDIGAYETLETIPTVSAWGLVVLTLLLLIGAKIWFARRATAAITA